ncbi:HNH endonuclease [Arthrobacter sp. AOP36-A1-22]|uniref:HNH endonuclease n=1 Tax=Arthrobacter sp. AOP36-A1-22 TaxID=3457684 RepID=UPI004033F5AD
MNKEGAIRREAIQWLKFRSDDGATPLDRDEILDFHFEGEPFRLQPTQTGIWKPRGFEAALSIVTVFRGPKQKRPYEDTIGNDNLIRYAWRGDDPNHHDNRALRSAMENQVPIIWFIGVGMGPATFQVVCPVYLIAEEPKFRRFVIAPVDDEAFLPRETGKETEIQETVKRYLSRETRVRLHQPVFRATVLRAYETHCAVCNLGHRVLLDAAHVVPDADELGIASVVNGMALCKIHHAAFDSSILGVSPDHRIHIRRDLLEEIDGPMLQHGLKELHGSKLMKLPAKRSERPRSDLLEIAYKKFLEAEPA